MLMPCLVPLGYGASLLTIRLRKACFQMLRNTIMQFSISLIFSQTLSLSLILTNTLFLSHSHIYSLSLSLSLSYANTHILSLTLSLAFAFRLARWETNLKDCLAIRYWKRDRVYLQTNNLQHHSEAEEEEEDLKPKKFSLSFLAQRKSTVRPKTLNR